MTRRVLIALFSAVLVLCLVGAYRTWRDCTAAGGVTVRGLFGLECISR